MKSKSIAIIPARGGSKRIPRKNVKSFLGKPIIQYSIETAINSKCFDHILVSTDDPEISKLSKQLGAEVPFLRSKKNSSDSAMLDHVVEEVLTKLDKQFSFLCCILPTAPFITDTVIKETREMISSNSVDTVVPVVKFSFPIQRAFHIRNNLLEMIHPENYHVRSQDLEPTYHDSGQFYWKSTKHFNKSKSLFSGKIKPYFLNEMVAQDIDTLEDWEIAEFKYKLMFHQNNA